MKKRLIFRIVGIGILHAFLYLYVVPSILYPRFGHNGLLFAVMIAILVSVVIVGTMFIGKNIKGDN